MVTTAVGKWPAYARLSTVAPAGHLPTAPTPSVGTRPRWPQQKPPAKPPKFPFKPPANMPPRSGRSAVVCAAIAAANKLKGG